MDARNSHQKKLPHFLLEIELKVEDEILVLFGPSGSGKTSILNNIAGLDKPDSGYIKLNGKTYFSGENKPLPTKSRNIGYLFQDYALFPHMTVEKNITYGMKKKKEGEPPFSIEHLVGVLGIQHLLKKYPHQISGGETKGRTCAGVSDGTIHIIT